MTPSVRHSTLVWCLRLFSLTLALWAVYRHLLRPDWAVRIEIGSEVRDTYMRSWIWDSPDAVDQGGVVGGVRWGKSLFSLAVSLVGVYLAWWIPAKVDGFPRHPKQPASAPSGARG
jgi:hypothetical protein